MNYEEAYNVLDNMCDKSGTAWFNEFEKNIILKQGTYNYLKSISDNFESNKEMIDGIYTLVSEPTLLTVSNNIAELPSNYAFRLAMYINSPENEIRYTKLNNWSHTHDDTHSDIENVTYGTLIKSGFLLTGDLTGNSVYLFFIKDPSYNFNDTTEEWVDLPEQTQYEVIKHSFKLATTSLGDERYQLGNNLLQDGKT